MNKNLKRTFSSHDGAQIHYRHRAAQGQRRGAIVILHRGHEHSGRVAHIASELDLPDFDVFMWDARGHGDSPGPSGDAPSFACLVRDLHSFVQYIHAQYHIPSHDLIVIGQSVGAVIASTWVHDYAPKIRGLILSAPAFSIKLYVPFARPGLALLSKILGNFFVTSYVQPRFLTHDPQRQLTYKNDPLINHRISVRVLLGMYEAAERVVDNAATITTPVQLLLSENDWVVHKSVQRRFFENLPEKNNQCHQLHGFLHDTFGESARHIPIAYARDFIAQQFSSEYKSADLSTSDQSGYTFDQYQKNRLPLSRWSLEYWFWLLYRGSIKIGGLFSQGIKTGNTQGFDSGASLDYIYQNHAQGAGRLGRFIDRGYLDAIGWRGVRQRRQLFAQMLTRAIDQLTDKQISVDILDIAAGPGRYVLDTLKQHTTPVNSVLLRDYQSDNIAQAQQHIHEHALSDIAKAELGSAFERDALQHICAKKTLAIVSGLYELYPDNAEVVESLQALSAMPCDSLLIYTGQPWHPQLSMIARALNNHRGAPWVMRCRAQAELDQLVENAGFEKIDQFIDDTGIFTVSLARRCQ